VSRPLVRYRPSRRYLLFALIATLGAVLSAWTALGWSPHGWRWISWLACGGFGLTALAIFALLARPSIEIHESHLQIGRRILPWGEIHRVDQTRWLVPLALRLSLEGGEELLLVHPGDLDSSTSLLRHLRRYSRHALLDGIPYRQFWGEPPAAPAPSPSSKEVPPLVRYPLLRPEDEREVEQLFRRLKSEGRLGQHAPDEKIGEK
jgi:hypothetical protein